MANEVISVTDVVASKRGRQASFDSDLLAALEALPSGKALALSGTFGLVPKEKRPAIGGTIRRHWAAVRTDECVVKFSPEGLPQVMSKVDA